MAGLNGKERVKTASASGGANKLVRHRDSRMTHTYSGLKRADLCFVVKGPGPRTFYVLSKCPTNEPSFKPFTLTSIKDKSMIMMSEGARLFYIV